MSRSPWSAAVAAAAVLAAAPVVARAQMSPMHPAPTSAPPRTLAVLLYDGFAPLDAVGPLQMVGMLRMQGWRVVTVAKARGPVPTENGYAMEAVASLADVPRVDALVVPGGLEGTYRAARDTAITRWIARVAPGAQAVASVCTGAWVLAGAHVLGRGDTAATHWLAREELERSGVVYTADRVHRAGRVWTSAGVSAGIDLGLALTAALGGRELAEHAQLVAQYDPRPPFDAGSPEKAPEEAERMRARHAALMKEIVARAAADRAKAVGASATAAARGAR